MMPSYLSRPESVAPAPAVIVLQEIFGVNTEMRRITDLVASAGYVGLAINYYHRTDPELNCAYDDEGVAKGRGAASKVTRQTIESDLNAAMDWLNAQDFVRFNRIATWGFCFGGSMAFFSSMLRGISGGIVFYGGQVGKPLMSGGAPLIEEAERVKAPLLMCYGGKDQGIPPDEVERIESGLRAHKKRFTLKVYPDEGHGFFRQSSKELDNPDLGDAWSRVQEFLKASLW
ncbi:MAG TPA: dienelactone hydrolase family protein [Candidatus Baltobacteraceae bacterium]|jgi:carboxymethylenebutenolidase